MNTKIKIFYSFIDTIHKDIHEDNTNNIRMILNELEGVKVYENKISKGENEIESRTTQISENLQSSDIFIGEMSKPSQTLGFLLGQAINQKKPCLYLYSKASQGVPKGVILYHPSRLLTVKSYDKDTLKPLLESFLKKARKQLLSDRITFVCSKAVREYIDNKSLILGLPKGELIRTIIEEKMDYENP